MIDVMREMWHRLFVKEIKSKKMRDRGKHILLKAERVISRMFFRTYRMSKIR
jgi:hypothetical protein